MKTVRLSLAKLMLVVAMLALMTASIVAATDLWSRIMFTVAVGSQGIALFGWIFARPPERAGWGGFFVAGGGYMMLCAGPWCSEHVMPRLVTTALADEVYTRLEYLPKADGERVWMWAYGDSSQVLSSEGVALRKTEGEERYFDIQIDRALPALPTASIYLRGLSRDSHRRLWHADLSLALGALGAFAARSWSARLGAGP